MKTFALFGWVVGVLAFLVGCEPATENTMQTTIIRGEDSVLLEGVEGWHMGGRESSVHAAQASIMAAMGEEIDYTYLLGVSGLAFRMQISQDGMCPSSPHGFVGYECSEGSDAAIPYESTVFKLGPEADEATIAAARAAVVESIDRGVPARYGTEELGVIIGYQKAGEEWTCLNPMRGGEPYVEPNVPWGVTVYGEPKAEMPSQRELVVASLRQAVMMAHTDEAGGYYVGFAAWDNYIAKLEALQGASDDELGAAMIGNSWIYECLTNYREFAAMYLRAVAPEFGPDVAHHLLAAAELYDEMSAGILKKDSCVLGIAPLLWSLEEGQTWDDSMRAEQLRRLKAALPLERQAIAQLEDALTIIDTE